MTIKKMVVVWCMSLAGCNAMSGTTGGDSMTSSPNDTSVAGFTTLPPINFSSDVTQGTDPTNFSIGSGSIDFAGGMAATVGIPPLYFDDSFAWTLTNSGTATITFNNLDVRSVEFYLAHRGTSSVTLTAEDANGGALGTVESFQAVLRGDNNARFTIDGLGATIQRLTIIVAVGDLASLDNLILTVSAL